MSIRTRFNPLGTIGRKSLLPAGYIELEYLESTGTQYIDTGLLCNYSYIIDLDIVTLKAKGIGFQSFFGYAATSTQNYKLSAYVGQNNNFAAYIGNNAAVTTPNDVATPGSKHSIRITEKCLYVDNILYSDSAPVLQAGNGNMYLFARNGSFNSGQFRIYTFKVKLNNKLVLNFIPALDPTGRPCMFDLVTRRPFYNQGTGEFLWRLKKDTLPSGYSRAYSVYFDGATVLDSLIPAKTGYDVELKFNNKAVADRNMFSARKQPGNIRMFYMAITNGPATHYIGRGDYVSIGLPFSTGVIKTWRSVLGKDANYGNVNSFTYTTTSPGLSELDFGISLYLGGIHDTDGRIPSAGMEMDFYRLTVKNEGSNTLLANLVPVYNAQTSTAGVYDVVNNRMLPTVMGNVRLSS